MHAFLRIRKALMHKLTLVRFQPYQNGTANMERIMWTVVYMSQDRIKVNKMLAILESNEIISMVKASGEDDFDMGTMYEILVPKTELESAQELILDAELTN